MNATIITNNHYRDLVHGYEMPESKRSEFDYMSDDEFLTHEFIRYGEHYYDVASFMRTTFKGWHGSHSETAFSAILVKFSDDGERVKVGRAYA